ncbi:signal peptide peptidase SppA [Siccirubricoccus sp. KC 17139]|uniref:Signal peptide peptidase SppA n=1 Tax=Siccirubricoccus soli TaxID=2899147 RepID=A0ABT1D8S2_9PROT|nr:signal peptide peptidase SppA [Siccirubricoccus soli]MCO6417655.1 signal peptide peptidase SppA [Siccirubricoccus soli]MCP2683790.1 signal peptide peptidase SppA [Siccirubricoccus soli]
MSLDADLLIDRRRLKRRLALWRGLAVLLLLAGALTFAARESGLSFPGREHVARLTVQGFIGDDRKLFEALEALGEDRATRALIVAIDSPGGSVGGGEALYATLQRLREKKPVVAVMRGTAASAAYMAALGTDRVYARDSTVTGSIGVLLQAVDVSELAARLGVRGEAIVSGPLKAQPNPLQPLSPEGRAALQAVVQDMYEQFLAKVVAARRLPEEKVRALADGRVFTGRQALAEGLIDAIGGEAEARAWLAAERQVPESLPVREVETRGPAERLFGALFQGFWKSVISEWLGVDGPRLLWQLPG